MQNNARFWRAQNGRHTLLLLALPIASCCGGLYCTISSYARLEYAVLYACATLGCCGWQRWWPGSRRRWVSIEMAGYLALGCHGGERWSVRTAGGLRIRTAWVEGTAAGDVKP